MSSSAHTYDIVIVGGGPAGSSAAIKLTGIGLRVALIEKASYSRYKTCSGTRSFCR